MLAYARHQFWLAGFDKGASVCRREALEQVAKTLGRLPKELENAPELPPALVWLWDIYTELHNATSGLFGYNELSAYLSLTDTELSPEEVNVIMKINREFRHG